MSTTEPVDLGVLLNIAFNAFKGALEKDLAAAGFDDIGPSFGYVFRLLADGDSSLGDLADKLQITPPGALKLVESMVAKGYVSRSADPSDKRVKRLRLTRRGRAALRRARDFHARCEQTLRERLGSREVAAARRVLDWLAGTGEAAASQRPRPA